MLLGNGFIRNKMYFFISIGTQFLNVLYADDFPLFDNGHTVAHLLHFAKNVGRKQNRGSILVFFTKYGKENLLYQGVKSVGRFIENNQLWRMEQIGRASVG